VFEEFLGEDVGLNLVLIRATDHSCRHSVKNLTAYAKEGIILRWGLIAIFVILLVCLDVVIH